MKKENTTKTDVKHSVLSYNERFACSKKCSDYDEDCMDVKDPIGCWMGGDRVTKNGICVHTDTADGYCPLTQNCN